jgi:hypothetical protein
MTYDLHAPSNLDRPTAAEHREQEASRMPRQHAIFVAPDASDVRMEIQMWVTTISCAVVD